MGRDALCGKTTFKLRVGGGESRDQPGRMGEAGPVKQDERLPRLYSCSGEALRGKKLLVYTKFAGGRGVAKQGREERMDWAMEGLAGHT